MVQPLSITNLSFPDLDESLPRRPRRAALVARDGPLERAWRALPTAGFCSRLLGVGV